LTIIVQLNSCIRVPIDSSRVYLAARRIRREYASRRPPSAEFLANNVSTKNYKWKKSVIKISNAVIFVANNVIMENYKLELKKKVLNIDCVMQNMKSKKGFIDYALVLEGNLLCS